MILTHRTFTVAQLQYPLLLACAAAVALGSQGRRRQGSTLGGAD